MNVPELQELIEEIRVGKAKVDAAQAERDAAQAKLETVENEFRDLVNKLLEHAIAAPIPVAADS